MMTPQQKAKITWHCRRGMLELDIIFERFIKHHLDSLTQEQVAVFERLLSYPDPDLYAWLMGYEDPVEQELIEIVIFIRTHNNV